MNTYSYTFNALGQLVQATGGSTSTTVEYDPSGMLSKVTSGGTSTDYLYDGGDLVAQYNGATVLRKFVHGPGMDEPLVWYEGSGTSTRKYLFADERGSIITVSDNAGVASTAVKYSPYGESGALASVFGYTGQLYLPTVNAYYYKARMYSPETGRFLSPDPIGYADGMNLYGYVGGDPVNSIDPSGLNDYDILETLNITGSYTGSPLCSGGSTIFCGAFSPGDFLQGLLSRSGIMAGQTSSPGDAGQSGGTGGPQSVQQGKPGGTCKANTPPAFMSDPDVVNEMNKAWNESNPNAPSVRRGQPGSQKHEQGGWVTRGWFSSSYDVIRVVPGTRDSLPSMIDSKPWPIFLSVEGWFHTHPNTSAEGYSHLPSPGDINFTKTYAKVPSVIKTHAGDQYICP